MTENEIGTICIQVAIEIHRNLGPGLFESVYEVILAHELTGRGLRVVRQVPVPIKYNGLSFEEGFRADLIVEEKVILELKSLERISKAHEKQVLTYLRLTDLKPGYVLNFGSAYMKDVISRIVNGLRE